MSHRPTVYTFGTLEPPSDYMAYEDIILTLPWLAWLAVGGEHLCQTKTLTLRQFIYRFILVYSSGPIATGWLQTICVINLFMCRRKMSNC